jgi:hypothetical protein
MIGSAVRCGMAPCPPVPLMWMLTSSEEAMAGPSMKTRWPWGTPGMLCMAYTASQGKRSNRPSWIIIWAPPGCSSAGWKIRFSVPLKQLCKAKCSAAASSMAVCPSCPQACMTPSCRLVCGSPVVSWIGSASMSARRPRRRLLEPRRNCPTRPVPAKPRVTS